MLVDRTNIFVNNNERKWLRKNIQLIRNPEIFDLENMNSNQNKSNKIYLNNKDEVVILPNRPFSYNIQNIFMIYILNKLSEKNSEFMSIFKNTNLYLGYNDQKKYQNNSGMKISENITELKKKNKQRNIENCFTVEYHLQNFKTQRILKIINSKIKSEEKDEYLENLKNIFQNYRKMKNEEDSIINELGEYYKDIPGRKSDVKRNVDRFTKILTKKFQRTNSFLLSETNYNNNYNFLLEGTDKTEGEFKFYKKNGFLNFIKNFETFLENEKIDIKDELYNKKICEQILDIIIRDDSIFNQNKYLFEKLSKLENKQNNNKEKKEKKESTIIESRTRSIEIEFNPLYSNMELNQFLYSENILEFIPDFSEDKNNYELNNKEEDNINLKSQYYLYICSYLEKIMESKEKTEEFIEKIISKKNIKDLNIKSLIVKLYRRAYNCSGKKHLDFPYFSYYIFLKNEDLNELKLLNDEFTYIESDEAELYEIYENVIKEKELALVKLEEKRKKKLEKEKMKEEGKLKKENGKNKNEIKIEKDNNNNKSSRLQDLFNFFENKLFEKKIVKNNGTSNKIKTINQNKDFNYFISYYINNEPDFNIKNVQNHVFIEENIIQNISKEILSILPYKKEVNIKINEEIITSGNKRLIQNKKLFELIGLLKIYSPEKLQTCKQRICFWVNCFNFLIIFTIFYKKWIINTKDDWKYFFQNVIYTIGGKKYTFNDMQYILFKRPLFFTSNYKSNDEIKKLRVDKADDFKNIEKKFALINSPFMIYLPTKEFLKPIIFYENELENQINNRTSEYLNKYIYKDEANNIILPELLTDYSTRFLYKEYKKYQYLLNGNLYNLINDKKYKKNIILSLEFKLDFDNILE